MQEHSDAMLDMEDDGKGTRRFNEVIERIEQVRRYLGLNRSKFCRTIGMSPQTYNNFIGPQGTKPNIQLLHGVVTRFGVDPMWLFTGRGTMFLPGYGVKPGLHVPGMGVAEASTPYGGGYPGDDQGELASLVPMLRRIEALLQERDGQYEPLLNRFTGVFRRYMQLHPETAVNEIVAFLEGMERRLAQAAGETNPQ